MEFVNKFSLTNKIIIITGCAGFLGKQFATVIANNNGIPVLLDVNYKKALLICKNLKNFFGVESLAIKCNVTKENQGLQGPGIARGGPCYRNWNGNASRNCTKTRTGIGQSSRSLIYGSGFGIKRNRIR